MNDKDKQEAKTLLKFILVFSFYLMVFITAMVIINNWNFILPFVIIFDLFFIFMTIKAFKKKEE